VSDDPKKILTKFKSIFSGAQDRFTIHVPPFTHNEKKHKQDASWVGWAQYGKASFKDIPDGYEPGDDVPVTTEQYKAHLNGEMGLALSPLVPTVVLSDGAKENVCAYGIIDIDTYGVNYTFLIQKLYASGFQFAAFMSKSGGLHIYFMFKTYEPAAEVRQVLLDLIKLFGLPKLYKDEKNGTSKVEVFPDHGERKPGMKDKCIFLPFFDALGECPNKMITAEGKLVGITKALPLIEKQFTTLNEVKAVISALPYSDAPYCIQAALLNGALWEGSHRNDFLFTVALYLKLKHGKDAFTLEMLAEANSRFEEPLEAKHVETCHRSASEGDFPLLGQCKKEPMATFCDRVACKERKYAAVKKDKNNVASNIEFGQVFRMKAETPYYLLEARLAGDEGDFKVLRVDAAENFLNQKTIQKECVDKLGQIMWTVKQQVWEERVNAVLQNLQEKEVPKEIDTSELSDLRELFHRYLTHKCASINTPNRINLKQVYFADGVYYFKNDGVKDYLRIAKYTLGRVNLTEELKRFGCTEGEVSWIRKDGTLAVVKCWMKQEDDVLKEMTRFFDDVVDEDAEIIAQNKLNKGGDDGEAEKEERRF